jgi:hypothetical protein
MVLLYLTSLHDSHDGTTDMHVYMPPSTCTDTHTYPQIIIINAKWRGGVSGGMMFKLSLTKISQLMSITLMLIPESRDR